MQGQSRKDDFADGLRKRDSSALSSTATSLSDNSGRRNENFDFILSDSRGGSGLGFDGGEDDGDDDRMNDDSRLDRDRDEPPTKRAKMFVFDKLPRFPLLFYVLRILFLPYAVMICV